MGALAWGDEHQHARLDEIVSFTAVVNRRSEAVMQRLGITHDPADDFDHPALPTRHSLRPHVFYRMRRRDWEDNLRLKASAAPDRHAP